MINAEEALPLANELAAVAARASGLLLSEKTVAETLKLITEAAKLSFPDAVGAGVTLIDENARKISMAASDPIVEEADALQYALEEGPCLTAWATGETVVVDDVATDPRWPRWSQSVATLAVTACISVPMKSGGQSFGAVKVYSDTAWAFNTSARRVLELLVAQATVLLEHAQTAEGAHRLSQDLQHALRSRDLIGMAKGLVMERDGVGEEDAMQRLMRLAVADRATLRDTAVRLVEAAVRHVK
ncbi:GAF and ANTAR domain-containing protein [Arthrobacter sp. ERGS1:01]|uniref:GAF and ANTAR domain-containing protein n=1 Tax=Arthrobacter sp. ERGS1:01 TaxID=1704044 RepID=UPI0006B52443|nr:GAF and ANTAR domain-containing protein [Arthrobacter sp. ERGS1:01]